MGKKETAGAFVKKGPPLRHEELAEINELYPHYLFRRSCANEIWTTCCQKHVKIDGEATDAEHRALTHPHTREERGSTYWGWVRSADRVPENIECPYCGASVRVKELRYTGHRDNLYTYRRAVVLRQWRGDLWAMAYTSEKSYREIEGFTALPEVGLMGVYRFRPGAVDWTDRGWWYGDQWGYLQHKEKPDRWKKSPVHDPYTYTKELGTSYGIIGIQELEKSFLRYCYYAGATRSLCRNYPEDIIEYLTAASFYPRKIEMLQKAGLHGVVHDFILDGIKNAAVVNWETEDRRKFLKLSRQEIEDYLNGSYDTDTLRTWAALRKTPAASEMQDVNDLLLNIRDGRHRQLLLTRMRRWGVNAGKLMRYLRSQPTNTGMGTTIQIYVDYITAAEGTGLDMTNPVIQMPRDLIAKHDRQTAAFAALQNTEKDAAYKANILPGLEKRYGFDDGEYFIRPPVNGAEIKVEGEVLSHCVGGYVDRHLKGITTILLLRRCSEKDKPLATIEMHGNKLVQVHGYRNECVACHDNPHRTPARKLYASILEPWLDWVKRGSPRQADGTPKLRKRKKKKKDAA